MTTAETTEDTDILELRNGPSLIELGVLWANGAELVTGLYLYFDDKRAKRRWQIRSVEKLERDPHNGENVTITCRMCSSDGEVKERRMKLLYHRTLRSAHAMPTE